MEKEVISIKALNELFGAKKENYFINEVKGHLGISEDSEGSQGEYNERFLYYQHPEMPKDLFLQKTYQTDSYAEAENLIDIKFVKGKAKQIIVYQPI